MYGWSGLSKEEEWDQDDDEEEVWAVNDRMCHSRGRAGKKKKNKLKALNSLNCTLDFEKK